MGLLRGLFPTLLILGLTACVDFAELGDSDRYKEDFHYSYALSPGGTVSVENANGSIDIAGWDQNTVDISGTKYASTKSNLDSIKIETSAAAGGVRVRTVRPEEWHGNGGARYTIKVPRKVLLDTMTSTNGGIRVDDVDGNARLKSTNGSIRIHDLHGELNAHTTNGAMEADGLEGNANLEDDQRQHQSGCVAWIAGGQHQQRRGDGDAGGPGFQLAHQAAFDQRAYRPEHQVRQASGCAGGDQQFVHHGAFTHERQRPAASQHVARERHQRFQRECRARRLGIEIGTGGRYWRRRCAAGADFHQRIH